MFLLRIRPGYLFLLLMLPMLLAGVLQQAPLFASTHIVRWQAIGVNLSTMFAFLFTVWLVLLVWLLAPGQWTKLIFILLLATAILIRGWQDGILIEGLYLTGKLVGKEQFDPNSVFFIVHLIATIIVLITFVFLSFSLVKKEKQNDLKTNSVGITFLQFLVFPIGLFFIQKRISPFLEKE
jgi:hypothetical protein